MDLSVETLYDLLLRSRLLPRDEARALYDRWQAEAGDRARDAAQFARWLAAQHYVTEYQAALLTRGHADCFFLDDYRVLERLGKGRMAGVYRAQHPTGQQVAIKVLPPSKARDPQLLARFQRETRLALSLDHPYVVRAFEVGLTDGLHYLVMECLEGETLEEVLKRGRLPLPEAVRVAHQALLGLQHIHDKGLIHRDLKPGNLMMVPVVPEPASLSAAHGTVKILDMSLGRALDESTLAEKASDPEITTAGMMLGTPDYMAPEQANDPRNASVRSDIYSVGCVLYHLVTGQPPFPDTSVISQMIRHATETARPLKDFVPTAPDALQQAVSRMMAKDPAQRFATAERAARALRPLLTKGGEDADADPASDVLLPAYAAYLCTRRPPPDLDRPETGTASVPPVTVSAAPPLPAAPPTAPPTAPLMAPRDAPARLLFPGPVVAPPDAERSAKPRPERPRKQDRSSPAVPAAARPTAPVPSRTTDEQPEGSLIDVELLPALGQPAAPSAARSSLLQLSWRDVVLYLLGAATVLAAILVGWLFSLLWPK